MCDSGEIMSFIANLFSGLGGVCIGAWITYFLQEKSTIEKNKTEILGEILGKQYSGAALVRFVAKTAMIFQSQPINSNLKNIIEIYSDKGKYTDDEVRDILKKQFIKLAKSMREDAGISKDVLTNKIIEEAITSNPSGR